MKKYRVKSAVYNQHNEIEDHAVFTVDAENMAQAKTFADAHMNEHHGQEAYDADTVIEQVLSDDPNWQDRRYY